MLGDILTAIRKWGFPSSTSPTGTFGVRAIFAAASPPTTVSWWRSLATAYAASACARRSTVRPLDRRIATAANRAAFARRVDRLFAWHRAATYLDRATSRTLTRCFGWLVDHAGATMPDDMRA